MKILMVSVFSNHFFNWVLQLEDSGYEIYWLDVNDSNTYVKRIDFVHQIIKWKRKYEYPGRYWVKSNLSIIDKFINKLNNRKFEVFFQQKLNEIQPDVVHSFEMYSSCVSILDIMKKNSKIIWTYSAWGNDLFYFQREPEKLKGMKAVFERLNFMFADCNRDYLIAEKYGFKGKFLGAYPGGGGYELMPVNPLVKNILNRTTILIKGYQHKFGRANKVLESLLLIEDELKGFKIVVFAANEAVREFLMKPEFNGIKNLEVKGKIGREEVLELMGKSLIYIGNSISDGMPNTLLEAIVMEAFPIQSNPGGATAEIIEHGKNGFLIENPENTEEIAELIKEAIRKPELVKSGIAFNTHFLKPILERQYIKDQVIEKYAYIEKTISNNPE